MIKNQKGQVIIVMLLTTLVALSIGLIITQRSITDVTTSSQTEQASRAYSAAEAGIERALIKGTPGGPTLTITKLELNNQAEARDIKVTPAIPSGTNPEEAFEYPKISKEVIANFWLANPDPDNNPETSNIDPYYTNPRINIYFGNEDPNPDPPAVEVTIVTKDTSVGGNNQYYANKYFFESDPTRLSSGFEPVASGNSSPKTYNPSTETLTVSPFYRSASIYIVKTQKTNEPCTLPNNCFPVLARVRILYSNTAQKVAMGPPEGASCPPGSCLPPQANYYSATGRSGQSEKKIQLFKGIFTIPIFFDFAIFSSGDIEKK